MIVIGYIIGFLLGVATVSLALARSLPDYVRAKQQEALDQWTEK